MMKYLAHSPSDTGHEDSVATHLNAVAGTALTVGVPKDLEIGAAK